MKRKILPYNLSRALTITIIVLSYILILLGACGCKNESSLKIEVQNQHIYFVDSTKLKNYRYKDISDKESALNVITYTISNPTNKKYLLILDRDYMYPHFSENGMRSGSIGYFIKKADTIVKPSPGIAHSLKDPALDCRHCIHQERMNNYMNLGLTKHYSVQNDEFLRYSVTIFPGESRTFKTFTMLPLVLELNEYGGGILKFDDIKENCQFELVYYCNSLEFKKQLPKYLLDELEANDVDIFDGTLKAKPIPLKKR